MAKRVKGFISILRSSYKKAKEAILKAEEYAFRDRKDKKATMRHLWQTRIGAAVKNYGLSYSKFIHLLKEKSIVLDRKMLAKLASDFPASFKALVQKTLEK